MPKSASARRSQPIAVRAIRPGGRAGASAHHGRKSKGPLRIERRCEEREPATGSLAATYSGEGRHGITHLELVDRSPSGLGVRTRTQVEPGMLVTICPEGSTVPWLSARVARCVAEGRFFRVGLAFDRRLAA